MDLSSRNIRIIFATTNSGKIKEAREIAAEYGIEIISAADAGIFLDIVEDGTTFTENAVKKAVETCEYSKSFVFADDSGLEIDFLDKQPGVASAR